MPQCPPAARRFWNDDLESGSVVFLFGVARNITKLYTYKRKESNKEISSSSSWCCRNTRWGRQLNLVSFKILYLVDREKLIQMGTQADGVGILIAKGFQRPQLFLLQSSTIGVHLEKLCVH